MISAVRGVTPGGGRPMMPNPVQRHPQWMASSAKDGTIDKDHADNIILAVERLGVKFWYDAFEMQPYISGLTAQNHTSLKKDYGPELNDDAANALFLLVRRVFDFRPTRQLFDIVVATLSKETVVHPVREYLDSLTWDGTSRIERWLIDYGNAEDTEFNRAVGKIWLIAGVRRVRQPGIKFNTMPVLENVQGQGKSTMLCVMAVKPEWFSDNLTMGADSKITIERTQGIWIAEIAELTGMKERGKDHVNAFLSRQYDRARLAYGHYASKVPRQFICAATTNDSHYLVDSENRRYWPVGKVRFDLEKLRRDRDQLWAEAAYYEKQGFSIVLDEKLWPEAAKIQDLRRQPNPLEDILRPVLQDKFGWVHPQDIWNFLNIPITHQKLQLRNFGTAMKTFGFEQVQIWRETPLGPRGTRFYEKTDDKGEHPSALALPWDGYKHDENGRKIAVKAEQENAFMKKQIKLPDNSSSPIGLGSISGVRHRKPD